MYNLWLLPGAPVTADHFQKWTQQMTYQLLQCHSPRIAADRNTPRGQSVWESNRNSTLYPTGRRRSCRVYLSQKQKTSRAIPGSTASLQEMQPLYSHIFRWARLWLVQIGTLLQRWLSRPMLRKMFSKIWYGNEYSLSQFTHACLMCTQKVYWF